MKKVKFLSVMLIATICLTTICVGCKKSSNNDSPSDIVGSWHNETIAGLDVTVTTDIIINENGTMKYSFYSSDEPTKIIIDLLWKTNGDSFCFKYYDEDGDGKEDESDYDCVKHTVSGNKLTFIYDDDESDTWEFTRQ